MFAASKTAAVSSAANYIEDVFSTYLWTGTGSNQTLTTGIDTSTYGGLFWTKNRTNAYDHALWPTALSLSGNYLLKSNTTGAATYGTYNTGDYVSNSTTGVTVYGNSSQNYVTWTFRKQPKFFDVVTWTGDDAANRQISHSLGSVPGCIIVKRTDTSATWRVWHQNMVSNPANLYQYQLNLNTTNAVNLTYGEVWGTSNNVTSTTFQVGSLAAVNASGGTYVAYVFAHNAGGFGLTGTDNVISCGSVTLNSSGAGTVNLGYEPQWVLMKTSSSANDWIIFDTMRGFSVTGGSGYNTLNPNLSAAEFSGSSTYFQLTNTGFSINMNFAGWQNENLIYIAIRRGPMKVPTSGTSVFSPNAVTGNALVTTNFPVDSAWLDDRSGGSTLITDRLRGSSQTYYNNLATTSTAAENTGTGAGLGFDNNTGFQMNSWAGSTQQTIAWNFKRAPSFFDEVCYTGTGTNQFINHNLGVQPDLYIVKRRSATANWVVTINASIPDTVGILNSTNAFGGSAYNNGYLVNGTVPASNFGAGFGSVNNDAANASGSTYVAYLFATCAGVSKVGSYTGNGTTQTINCGFTGGARFVLIKRTDSTGDWYVWDTARGIVSGNDPYLLLNSTAAETTGTDYIDTYSAGFEISSTAPAAINASGGTFIFLAIA